jgi:hypothetical protein
MKKLSWMLVTAVTGFWINPTNAEWTGHVSAEMRAFGKEGLAGQDTTAVSIALQPEYYGEISDHLSFNFMPFARLDSMDDERTHYDIRALSITQVAEKFELRAGIKKVFWGVTESVHLVDIINQTDGVESLDGEEKLGQPMVNLSVPRAWGTIDLFVLPYFRERTFPGEDGRLRTVLPVDRDKTQYESDDKQRHIDYALRYIHTIGDWDIGLSYFQGTSRDPTFISGTNTGNQPILIPVYEQIKQTGLDAQLVSGAWLWKLETIYRTGLKNAVTGDQDYLAAAGGFEYTLVGVAESPLDIGIIAEYLYDDRGQQATTPFEDDVFLGLRFNPNDMAGSEALLGVIQDTSRDDRMISLEASRRITGNWKVNLEGYLFINPTEKDLLYGLRDDDYLQLEFVRYF